MIVRDGAPAHQGRDHRDASGLGEFDQEVGGVRVDDAAARNDEGALRIVQERQRLLHLSAGRARLVDRERLVGLDVELDLAHLHVEGEIDQDRPRPPGAHEMEGLLEHAWHQRRLANRDGPFRDGLGDRLDVDGLEVLLVHPSPRRLAGDAKDRDRVGRSGVQARDHVGARRSRGADAHADVAGLRPRVALGHVRGALDMTRQEMLD